MSTFEPLVTLKLSIQTALLGEVTDRLVRVTCGLKASTPGAELTPVSATLVPVADAETDADSVEPLMA